MVLRVGEVRATEKNLPATQASVGVMMMIYSGDFSYDGVMMVIIR